jgi:hypothetical protein
MPQGIFIALRFLFMVAENPLRAYDHRVARFGGSLLFLRASHSAIFYARDVMADVLD